MEDLEAAGIEDVRDWLAAYYGPNNCVLTLAGDVTYESALELVDKYFGSIPPGPPVARYRQWVPELDRNLRDQMQDRAPQARIYRVYHVPGWGDNEIERLKLVANVLSGSKSSRLDRRLIYEKELATSVSASVWDKEIAGNFIVVATIKPGVDPSLAERELDSVLAEFLESGPTEAELERARNRDIADLIRGMERLGGFSGRSAILSESTLFGGTPDAYLDQLKTMTEATPVHVRDTGRRWLDAHHYTLTVVPYPQLAARTSQLDRSILPELADPPEVTFPEVQRGSLDNGLELILLERHGAPIVNMTLAVDAGYAADPAGQSGIASLTLEAMESGTESRDAFEIVDELDSLGAYISTSNSLDLSFVRLRALRMHLEGALGVYADVVLNPSFPEEMVRIGKRGQLARIAQEKARPYATALRIVPRLLYGDAHAYANPLTGSGNEASVERLTRNELRQWHRTWFHPGNASLIVTGDVSMETLLPQVEKAFGDWKPGAAPKKNVADVDFPLEPRVYVVNKPDAPQSVIVAAEVSQRGAQGDALAMETVMRLFGGMSTSRLNRNLRLDKHWSYGVRGSLVDARGQRPFLVVAPVQTDKTRESMIELMREIREIAGDRPVVGEEFESIKRNMVLRLPGRFETLSSLESAAETIVNFDYPAQYYYDYARNVRGLKEEDLASAAAGFIKPDHLTWVVIGDLAKIEDGIRDLGFGRIVHLDVDGRPEPNRASPR
jgi:zinc protease